MLETMGEDYIRTARAKGLPERTRRRQARPARGADPDRHHLRPGPRRCCSAARCSPRHVFSLPGIGKLRGRRHRRTTTCPIVLGVTLFAAFFIVVANLVVDIVYAVIDPRVRLS